uniref:Reverse transcriptase domain-containing protein n=1 Tax=Heterorhabditis bacteriophora TaxID=37862 RepID=A0A1I7WVQ2_HETBA
MFMSRSVISHSYINFFLNSLTQLRSIRIMNTTGNITTSGPFHILACRDATYIQDGSTIVLELDNSIGFYSGLSKVAVVIIPRFTVNANMRIFPSAVDSFCLLDGADLLKIIIPPAYTQSSVKNLFRTLTDALSQEKASSLICDWRTRFSSREFSLMSKCLNPELHMALRFVLEQAGFSVGLHPKLPWIKVFKLSQVKMKKLMRNKGVQNHLEKKILKQPVYYKLYEREFPQCASFNYIIQRKNEGVLAVSLGHISMVVDLHRMLGKNWAKKLHLTSRQHDDVTCVILDRSLTAAQKYVFTKYLNNISQSPPMTVNFARHRKLFYLRHVFATWRKLLVEHCSILGNSIYIYI